MMENTLRKRLEILKNRARTIRRLYLSRRGLGVLGEPGEPCALVEAAPGEAIAAGTSPLYLIRTKASSIVADAPGIARSLIERAAAPAGSNDAARRFLFFDIETTGLTPSTYVFLCGMMYLEGGDFAIEQAFARDYSEEQGMLLYVNDVLHRFPVLVTFNGTSFDVPFVKTRLAVGRASYDGPGEHVDLLLSARQRFRSVLPNCRLETIERHLRGVEREGDIPGAEIPEAYHEFVRTGDARKIKRILHHNRMDLISIAVLYDHLLSHSGWIEPHRP
jgi:uncharacterized protein YprB with RNaseH-like and TPR domain